ncbi:MAG: hypothetical protein ACLGI5_17485 [Thermoleophilia bacterium]
MTPIVLRARLRRWRHHAALAALLCALIAVIGLHHGAPAVGAAHHDQEMVEVAGMCLGIFTAVGAAVVAVGLALVAFGRRRPAIRHHPHGVLRAARLPFPRVRAGPALLVLLCVSRR